MLGEDAVEQAIRKLRRLSPTPSSIVAVMRDRSRQNLSVVGRRRWDRLARLLQGLEWYRLECLDESGNLLDAYQPDDAQDDSAVSLDDIAASRTDPETARVQVVLAAVDRLADRQTKMLSVALDGIGAVVGTMQTTLAMMVQRMSHLERDHDDALKMIRAAAETVSPGNGHGGEVEDFLRGVVGDVITRSLSPGQRSAIGGIAGTLVQAAAANATDGEDGQ